MILVAVCAFVVLAAIKLVVLATLFAVLIGGTFLPVVDWLARHHVKRWIAAFLVVIFLILLAVGICLVVLYGLVNQWPEIQDNLQKAWDSIQKSLNSTTRVQGADGLGQGQPPERSQGRGERRDQRDRRPHRRRRRASSSASSSASTSWCGC